MAYRDKPDDGAEEYEIQPLDNEPLLPHYERYEGEEQRSRPRIRRRRPFICLCVLFALILPFVAVMGCLHGTGKLNKATWDQLPENMKEWIGKLTPGTKGEGNPDFPIDVGFPGPTPTGVEAALVATAPAMPMYTPVSPLSPPKADKHKFAIMNHWGNLSPYHSVKSHGLPEGSHLIPEGCELDELHWLQRHGARYPTSNPHGPAGFAARIKEAKGWKASGELNFLNKYKYMLGAELLTPYGRQQLFNLGVSARVKYGFLLDKMKGVLPVLRTESQDRMLRSAQNWAAGFFGIPDHGQYNLEVMIESPGFNCSLAPYHACPNDIKVYPPTLAKLAQWDGVFLKAARKRLNKLIDGYDLTFTDVKEMMDTCAYETTALGYSAFCPLFTDEEWRGYQYRWDIYWWYSSSFGSPVARAQGLGWVQELTARLTHTPITTFNSSINSTLHNPIHFPLNHSLYVDFTHDTTFAQLLPTMNLTSFGALGHPPTDHIPRHWPFVSSKFAPFATNLQVQVLTCANRVASENGTDGDGGWWPFGNSEEEDDEDMRKRKRDEEAEAEEIESDESESESESEAETEPESEAEKPEEPEPEAKPEPSVDPNAKSRFIRLILNDAPVPLTGINGCKKNDNGLCDFDAFVSSMHTLIGSVNFAHDCHTDYSYNEDHIDLGQPK